MFWRLIKTTCLVLFSKPVATCYIFSRTIPKDMEWQRINCIYNDKLLLRKYFTIAERLLHVIVNKFSRSLKNTIVLWFCLNLFKLIMGMQAVTVFLRWQLVETECTKTRLFPFLNTRIRIGIHYMHDLPLFGNSSRLIGNCKENGHVDPRAFLSSEF